MAGKKSEKEIANDKAQKMMNGIAVWTSYFRNNPQRFVKEYLNIELKLFQKILIYGMMHFDYFCYIAARG